MWWHDSTREVRCSNRFVEERAGLKLDLLIVYGNTTHGDVE